MKKILAILAAILFLAAPLTAQDVHNKLFFKTRAEVIELVGEPTTESVTNINGEYTVIMMYTLPQNDQIVWFALGIFSNWYPELKSWQLIYDDSDPRVMNIAYYPILIPAETDKLNYKL